MKSHIFDKVAAKKILLATTAVTLLAYTGYKLWKSLKTCETCENELSNKPNKKSQETKNNQKFLKGHIYHLLIKELKPLVAEELKNNKLNKQILILISKATIQLIQNEYISNLLANRKLRRNFMNNHQLYSDELFKGALQNEELIKAGTSEILKELGIDQSFYDEQARFTYLDDPSFAYMSIFMLDGIKNQIHSKKQNLNKESLITFFESQIDDFDKHDFQGLKLPVDSLLIAKQTYISDLASIKSDIEEEDYSLDKKLLADPEIVQLAKLLEEKVYLETQKTNRFSY